MAQAGPKAIVAIAGSSGLIGSALAAALRAADHPVLRVVRRTPASAAELHWNPESGEFDADALAHVDAVVNLLRARGLRYATVTGVARDDLSDGGARLYTTTVRATKELNRLTGVEHLIPDFNGEPLRLPRSSSRARKCWRTTSKRLSHTEIAGRRKYSEKLRAATFH